MIILTTSELAQSLSVIPREYAASFSMSIRDDSTNVDNFKWNENERQVLDLYNDKIFCTDQDVNQLQNEYFKLNKGQYIEYKGFDNTYTVP